LQFPQPPLPPISPLFPYTTLFRSHLGFPHEHVTICRCVMDTGDIVELGRVPRVPPLDLPDRFRRLHRAAIELLDRHAPTITGERSQAPFNRCGYRLDALTPEYLDYPRLLAGSEGTLAVLTELTVQTQPRPGGRGGLLLRFAELNSALRAVPRRGAPRPQ